MNAFEIGALEMMEKIANPATPVKQSLPTGKPEAPKLAPYLNMGGGAAAQHVAGEVAKAPQPWPGHVNVGDKKPGTQSTMPAPTSAPATGELGESEKGEMTRTKSAAFWAGAVARIDE